MSNAPPRAETQALTRAHESLRLSEERFRLLVESVKDYAIFMLDPSGNVMSWNIGAERIKGYTMSEIVGRHFSVFYQPEDAWKCAVELEDAARDGRIEDEGWRIRKDGSRFWANVVITALRDGRGELVGYAKVTRDLTDRRKAEEERLRLAQAQEANHFKDEFLATVSHELRTPLNSILGWSWLLLDKVTDPEGVKAVETIRRNANAQAKLIEDILDVSRIITGKLRLDLKPIDLAGIVRDAIEVVRPSAERKGVEIVFERVMEPALLVGDPVRLQQVVWNLLSNAVKFTDAGKVFIRIELEGSAVKLSVRDTGRGIEPDFLPYVFERFRQADASTTRKFGGLGLGLAIAHHIVELHGGQVTAESEGAGRGSTFVVRLPTHVALPSHDAATVGAGARAGAANLPAAYIEGVRVLVVDSQPDTGELLSTLLRDHGASVEVVGSDGEVIEALQRLRPHVLVNNIDLSKEDGYRLVASLRALARSQGGGTPAVAITSYPREEGCKRAFGAGYNNHVSKPVDPDELVTIVRNLARVGSPFEDE